MSLIGLPEETKSRISLMIKLMIDAEWLDHIWFTTGNATKEMWDEMTNHNERINQLALTIRNDLKPLIGGYEGWMDIEDGIRELFLHRGDTFFEKMEELFPWSAEDIYG